MIRAPRGSKLTCKGWHQEAALRMLMNNLDPEVAERPPQDLVVYGGSGKAARNWDSYEAIVRTLKDLENDETLLVQSGKPIGVFKTTPPQSPPRVLLANSNLVPAWGNWEHFRELERKGLIMFGQMTAGSWIYIGTQGGILQGTYETLAELAEQHFDGTLKGGRLVLTAGLGGMGGGAQPLAVTMNGGVAIVVEVDPERIEKRLATRYCQVSTDDFDEALRLAKEAQAKGEALSIGLLGNAADVLPEFVKRGVVPDVVTDQTSAHDPPLNGYIPAGLSLEQAAELRKNDPDQYIKRAKESMGAHVRAMLELQARGAVVFDYGNNIRQQAQDVALPMLLIFPDLCPPTSGLCSVKARGGLSAGWRSRVRKAIFTKLMKCCAGNFLIMNVSCAGLEWPKNRSLFRAYLPASAGWVMANGQDLAY